jgi:hypothetical protein
LNIIFVRSLIPHTQPKRKKPRLAIQRDGASCTNYLMPLRRGCLPAVVTAGFARLGLVTFRSLPSTLLPFKAWMAASPPSVSISTKPKPRERPVSRSVMILAEVHGTILLELTTQAIFGSVKGQIAHVKVLSHLKTPKKRKFNNPLPPTSAKGLNHKAQTLLKWPGYMPGKISGSKKRCGRVDLKNTP